MQIAQPAQRLFRSVSGRPDADQIAGHPAFEGSRRPFRNELPAVHDGQAIAQGVRFVQVVGGQKDRGAGLLQLPDLIPEVGAVLRIKADRRLVEEQDGRAVDQAQRDFEAALLPAGVRLHGPVGHRRQFKGGKQLAGAGLRLAAVQAVQPAGQHQIFPSGRFRISPAGLARVADAPAHVPGAAHEVEPADGGAPAIGGQQGGEHAEGRRFAGSVGAEKSVDFSMPDPECDAAHRFDDGFPAAGPERKRFAQADGFDRMGHGRSPPVQGFLFSVMTAWLIRPKPMPMAPPSATPMSVSIQPPARNAPRPPPAANPASAPTVPPKNRNPA